MKLLKSLKGIIDISVDADDTIQEIAAYTHFTVEELALKINDIVREDLANGEQKDVINTYDK